MRKKGCKEKNERAYISKTAFEFFSILFFNKYAFLGIY